MEINLKRMSLALLSGALICFSFPKWNGWFCAWFAMVPMFYSIQGLDFKKSFLFGWLAGWAAFCGILYWIVPTFKAAGVSVAVGIFSAALLSGYIALYYGLFAGVFQEFSKRFSSVVSCLASSAFWVFLEYSRNHLFTGFPWGLLGYSQWNVVPLIQICEWTGVYGVSAFLVFMNLSLFVLIQNFKEKFKIFFFAPILLGYFSINLFLLHERNKETVGSGRKELRAAVLQGNIDQYKKWSPEFVQEILNGYEELVQRVQPEAESSIDLVVWPETSVPGWVPNEDWLMRRIQNTVKNTAAVHLIGAVTHSEDSNYNSAFLFDPDGRILARYDKMHLVPFGEFVPFQSLLGRWVPLLNQLGGFDPGPRAKVLEIPKARLGINICYEAIFPELVRKQSLAGAELLINITNDGWYLDTAAPEQHFSMNVFRAVENRRVLVRSANTGISGVIQPTGRISTRSELNTKVVFKDRVQLAQEKTFYSRFGDFFAWLCCGISLMAILKIFRDRKTGPPPKP